METTLAPRLVVFFLSLALCLPNSALALRARNAGLEERTHVTDQIERALQEFQQAPTPADAGLEEQEEKHAERLADDKATIDERRTSAVSLALLDTDKAREILKRIVSSPEERMDSRIIAAGALPLSSDPEILRVLLAVLTSQDRRNLFLRLFLPEVLRHLLFSSESEMDQVLDALRQNVSPIFEQAQKGYTPQIRSMFQMSVGRTSRIIELERRRVIAQRDFSELNRSLQQREEALKDLLLPSAISFLGQVLDDPDQFQAGPFLGKIVSTLSVLMELLRAHSLSLTHPDNWIDQIWDARFYQMARGTLEEFVQRSGDSDAGRSAQEALQGFPQTITRLPLPGTEESGTPAGLEEGRRGPPPVWKGHPEKVVDAIQRDARGGLHLWPRAVRSKQQRASPLGKELFHAYQAVQFNKTVPEYSDWWSALEAASQNPHQVYRRIPRLRLGNAGPSTSVHPEPVEGLRTGLAEGEEARVELHRFLSSSENVSTLRLLRDPDQVDAYLPRFYETLRPTLQVLGYRGDAWIAAPAWMPSEPLQELRTVYVEEGKPWTGSVRNRLAEAQEKGKFKLLTDPEAATTADIVIGDVHTRIDALRQILIQVDSESAAIHVNAELLRYLEGKDLFHAGTIIRIYKGDLDEEVMIFA